MKRFLYFDTYITGVAPSLTADRMLLAALFCAWGLSDQRMKVHACQEQAEYSVLSDLPGLQRRVFYPNNVFSYP